MRYEFTYDAQGHVTTVTDGHGNVTSILRDGSGNATAIMGPFAQQTLFGMHPDGYLATITQEVESFSHGPAGNCAWCPGGDCNKCGLGSGAGPDSGPGGGSFSPGPIGTCPANDHNGKCYLFHRTKNIYREEVCIYQCPDGSQPRLFLVDSGAQCPAAINQ